MDLAKFLDLLKQPAPILFVLAVSGLAVLALPDHHVSWLGFVYLRKNYQHWIGLGTIICLGLSALAASKAIFTWLRAIVRDRSARGAFRTQFSLLTPLERFYLAYCISRHTNTLHLEIVDPVATSLCAKGLLCITTGMGNRLAWPFIIPPHVWDYITCNPHVVCSPHDVQQLESGFREFEAKNQSRMF